MTANSTLESLRENVGRVREAIAKACRRSGREPGSVRLVAATKYVDEEAIAGLLALGVCDIGESRVQQLVRRAERFGSAAGGLAGAAESDGSSGGKPRWHLIGHLQRNKVRALLPHCRIVQSLDSVRLAEELSIRAELADVNVDVLMEINVAGEANKTGAPAVEALALAEAVSKWPRLRLCGLMTMAPPTDDPNDVRPCFAALRELRDRLCTTGAVGAACRHLSMGMSGDYEVAVEEGATIVRIGSALFERPRESVRAG